ncbi:hypothetical protein NDU88_004027 [Pleurodeles waltl]|uniref:Uncharacterized protein n=1 Tax=Pleurodeles waltl TaxID=8319 RepID=A0AAV7W959_PLEWA|nr:hypothetical protein NDU88_004027 [Pleurodeles waltl]
MQDAGVIMDSTTAKIMGAISDIRQDSSRQSDSVAVEFSLLRDDQRKLMVRVKQAKDTTEQLQLTVLALAGTIKGLTTEIHELESRAEDWKRRSHHNNIHIVGVEGSEPMTFFED